MKKNLFLAGAAAVVLASCVQEQLVEGAGASLSADGKTPISVRTFVGNSTKAGVVGIDSLQKNGFLVYAVKDQTGTAGADNADTADSQGNGWDVMEKKYVTWDSTDAAWEYSPIEYWPFGGTVDFYAYSIPVYESESGAVDTTSPYNGDVTLDKKAIVTFSTQTLIADQFDLLAGAALDCTESSTYATSGVSFNFQHVLSRIAFRAKAQSTFDTKNYKIVVNSLNVYYNTASAGTDFIKTAKFDITKTTTNVATLTDSREVLWETPTSTDGVVFSGADYYTDINTAVTLEMDPTTGVVNYTAPSTGTVMLTAGPSYTIAAAGDFDLNIAKDDVTIMDNDTRVSLTATNGYMMVIPQLYSESEYTTDDVTGAVTDNMKASLYAQVVYTLVKKNNTDEGSDWTDDAYAVNTEMTYVKNVPLPLVRQDATEVIPHGFNPGKTYTFELEIGAKAIKFSSQIGVEEWVPGNDASLGEDGFTAEDNEEDGTTAGNPVVVPALTTAYSGASAAAGDNDGEIKVTLAPYTASGVEVATGIRIEYTLVCDPVSAANGVTRVVEVEGITGGEVVLTDLVLPSHYDAAYTIKIMAIGAAGQYGYSEAQTISPNVAAKETI